MGLCTFILSCALKGLFGSLYVLVDGLATYRTAFFFLRQVDC